MKELIVISKAAIGDGDVNTVNARDLHAFLGVGKDFSNWIKKQIERARLVENRDFIKLAQKGEREIIGQIPIDYYLTIESAKHIGMISGTDKGFEVREYFIECEKQVLAPQKALPTNYKEALLQLVEQVEANEQLQLTVSTQAPKVEALDRISTADGYLCVTDAAKALQGRPKDLFNWLYANNWIYRRAGGKNWVAYQERLKQGLLSHKVTTVSRSDGSEKTVEQVLVTPKGLASLAERFC